jgi:DNA-binding GntR family transcriptional regulator
LRSLRPDVEKRGGPYPANGNNGMTELITPTQRIKSALGPAQDYPTAQAAVAERLRRSILSGRLPPGSRLLQAAVAEETRTSTTPVREAMRELAAEGLLDLDPHRGVVVHECKVRELEELYRLRMLLEPVAVEATVERITAGELVEAERILSAMEQENDVAEWVILNATFHSLLSDASRLPILTSILRRLRNLSTLYVAASLHPHSNRAKSSNQEHRAILEACRARDADRMKKMELAHLRHSAALGGMQFGSGSVPAEPAP